MLDSVCGAVVLACSTPKIRAARSVLDPAVLAKVEVTETLWQVSS